MRGRVRDFRRGVSESQVDNWINDRIRQAADYRTFWSSNIKKGVLSIPTAYTTGLVSVATGSDIVTGVGCNFPVDDVVSTSIADGIFDLGYQDFTPDSPRGITQDSILYVGTEEGVMAEAVPIVQLINPQTFNGSFQNPHNPGVTATQSSLVNRQFRISQNYPIFTILAVLDGNRLLLDQPWGGPPLVDQQYSIIKMYYTFQPNTQEILWVLDQSQGLPLRIHRSVRSANWSDPQRISLGPNPTDVIDAHPSPNGIIQWEIWPPINVGYQLQYAVYAYWPKLVRDTDRPPYFMNSTMFYHGALADALRFKANEKDSFHNPVLAREFEARFDAELEKAADADESKVLRMLAEDQAQIGYNWGSSFNQSHDYDAWMGLF